MVAYPLVVGTARRPVALAVGVTTVGVQTPIPLLGEALLPVGGPLAGRDTPHGLPCLRGRLAARLASGLLVETATRDAVARPGLEEEGVEVVAEAEAVVG